MITTLATQPKKVRGLSLLQKRIMAVAAKGWITPHEARNCALQGYAWEPDEEPLETFYARVTASSSRALRRLVERRLLVFRRAKYQKQSNAYILPNWQGDLPYGNSQHSKNAVFLETTGAGGLSEADKTLRLFDATVAERQKRLDTSLTKSERELGERLNMPLTDAQLACIADFKTELLRQAEDEISDALPQRLDTSLTESHQPALSNDVSVEEGRSVLVDILNRPQLGNHKSLVATNDGNPVLA